MQRAGKYPLRITRDCADHYSRIQAREYFGRYAIVISKDDNTDKVYVVYLATFGGRTSIPENINPAFWVPVLPAVREDGDRGYYEPLKSINGTHQWVSIRRRILLTDKKVSWHTPFLCVLTAIYCAPGETIHEEIC